MTFFDDDDASADPAARHRSASGGGPAMVGRGWALGLSAALLVALLGVIVVHSLQTHSSTPLEIIVQQPVPADNAPSDNHQDVTAPDPGDNP